MEKKLTNSGPLREPADKHSIYTRVRLTDGERKTLADLGQTLAVFPKEVLLQGAQQVAEKP